MKNMSFLISKAVDGFNSVSVASSSAVAQAHGNYFPHVVKGLLPA